VVSFSSLALIALGVSADAFAVALGRGLHMRRFDYRSAALVAVTFGVFQGAMPLIGWLLASAFAREIVAVDHWIAFGLLALVGGKMLYEAFSADEDDEPDIERIHLRQLLVLALATSIDALAVGISFAFLEVSILGAAGLIALVTLVVSFLGVVLGHRAGARLGRPAEVVGGVILILIGVSILVEHLSAG
jgi:putative Mn2+ efflux pump MntP